MSILRDPERISLILALLHKGWKKVPDWRFGQLIENFKRYIGKDDLFYLEDDDLIHKFISYFNIDEKEIKNMTQFEDKKNTDLDALQNS